MKMRIGTKLMLTGVLGVLAAVSVVSFAAYRIARDSLERGIVAHLESVAQSRAAHVQTFLREHKEWIGLMATSPVLMTGLRSLQAGGVDRGSVVQDLNVRLQSFLGPDGDIFEAFLLDHRGKVVASSNPEHIGLDRSADAYFAGARDGPFIKDAYQSKTAGRGSIAFSAPVLDRAGGGLLGIAVARLQLTGLDKITADRSGLGKTGETYLINRRGFMITPSRFRKDTFLKQKVDTENARVCLADMAAMQAGRPAVERERAGVVFSDYRAVPVLGVHAHVPEMGWGLLAEIDAGEAFAPIARLRATILAFAGLFTAVALAVAYSVARRISRPIHELHVGSERIGSGELDYRVRIKTGDEIEQLADEFNRMAEKLSESYASLEQRVAERTRELAAERERLRVTITSIGDAVIAVDTDSRVMLMNNVAERLTGSSAEEAVGRPLAEVFTIVNEETRRPAEDPVARALREGHVVGLANHTVLIANDGTEHAIADSAAPIRDEGGHIIGVVLVFRDVTEERGAQAELERFNRLAVGRELRMIELKREVNDMARRAEAAPPYDLAFADSGRKGRDDA